MPQPRHKSSRLVQAPTGKSTAGEELPPSSGAHREEHRGDRTLLLHHEVERRARVLRGQRLRGDPVLRRPLAHRKRRTD
eukprot:7270276-Prymnesium_polylepis.2